VLGRSAPALNLFSLGLPAGIAAGFAALIASAPLLTDRLMLMTQDSIAAVARVLGG
jgi:flagellar biosynthetic protein FliR